MPLAVGLVFTTGSALAEGPGVRVGDLVIHPSATVGGGYDSNVFYAADNPNNASERPVSASVLTVGGGLSFENKHANKVRLEFDGGFTYRNLVAVDDDEISDAVIEERNGLEAVTAGLIVDLLPRSSVGLTIEDDLRYTERPSNAISVDGFDRFDNAVGVDLRFSPGEDVDHRAFETRLGYRLHTVNYLGDSVGTDRSEKVAHEIGFSTKWRFFPKTALRLNVDYAMNDYPSSTSADSSAVQAVETNRDSAPLTMMGGLQGLLTKRVSLVLLGGYTNTFNAEGASFSGFVTKVQLRYVMEPQLSVQVGYERRGQDSAYSNYEVLSRVGAEADLFFLGKLNLNLHAGYDYYDFATDGAPATSAGEKRTDPIVRAGAALQYQARDWLQVALSWELDANTSNFFTPVGADPSKQDQVEYTRQVVLLQASAQY